MLCLFLQHLFIDTEIMLYVPFYLNVKLNSYLEINKRGLLLTVFTTHNPLCNEKRHNLGHVVLSLRRK